MVSRRFAVSTSILATAVSFFTLGVVHSRRTEAGASYDAKLDAIRAELGRSHRTDAAVPPGTEHRHFDLDQELSHILAES